MASLPSYYGPTTPPWNLYKFPVGPVQVYNPQQITQVILPRFLVPIKAMNNPQKLNRASFVQTNNFQTSPTPKLNAYTTIEPQANLHPLSSSKASNVVTSQVTANKLRTCRVPKYSIGNELVLSSAAEKNNRTNVQLMPKSPSVTAPIEPLTPATAKYVNPFEYNEIRMDNSKFLLDDNVNAPKRTRTWLCMICTEEKISKDDLLEHYENHKYQTDNLDDDKNHSEHGELLCPICSKVFINLETYQSHILNIHKSKEYYCQMCNKNFLNAYLLSSHNRQHAQDQNTLVCVVCKTFTTASSKTLMNHIRNIHEKDIWFCEECGKYFTSNVWYKEHKMFHGNFDLFCCKHCKQNFKNKRFLIGHMKKVHKTECIKLTKYKCDLCNWTFPFEVHMKKHMSCYHNPVSFLCTTCGKTFDCRKLLNVHLPLHSEKKFNCTTCGRSFHMKKYLKQHVLTHTGKKPHKCHICEKCFSQRVSLVIHIRTHTGERPYTCPKCGRGFVAKTPRDSHQKSCKGK